MSQAPFSQAWFDLATPDPDFPDFTVERKDQLPGRPKEGRLEIGVMFDHLALLDANPQRGGSVNGGVIFRSLKKTRAPVLGPNVGQFLYEHQYLIPVELRRKALLVFWGKVYRDSGRDRYVRALYWEGQRWVWYLCWIDYSNWLPRRRAVVLAKGS